MRGKRCDCGQPKRPRAATCEGCQFLDGRTEAERLLIAVMRSLGGGGTVDALLFETRLPERTLYRAIAHLRQRGRVVSEVGRDRAVYRLAGEAP